MYVRVLGLPQQQGSKNPWGGEANKKLTPWRGHVTQTVGEAWGSAPLLLGPVEVRVTFAFPRPQSHYGTGKNSGVLKKNAPRFKTSAPDLDKLQRAIGDALTATVFRDDAQVFRWVAQKIYDDKAYADITIIDLSSGGSDVTHGTARTREGSDPGADRAQGNQVVPA